MERRYRNDSLVLETDIATDGGVIRLTDCMPIRSKYPDVVRIVECLSGRVEMTTELVVRFDYGQVVPWVRKFDGRLHAIAGPDALVLTTSVETHGKDRTTVADFSVSAGQRVPFVLTWYPSYEPAPKVVDPFDAVAKTDEWWRNWGGHCTLSGPYRDMVVRSLITLKALTYEPTGAIVAAATSSLPETLGGERNWDYRFSWLRDATFTLYALKRGGYHSEAAAFRDWLLRAVAGDPSKLQIMYGIAGERHLAERTIDALPGYEGSRPVRIGNAAVGQLQLDVYGEVLDMLHQARRTGMPPDAAMWGLERAIVEWLETGWSQPDEGLWEVRGPRRQFTHSKVMTWVAMDRAVKTVEHYGLAAPVERWRRVRDEIRRDVCQHGFDEERNTFTQSYGSKELDASLLLIPAVGFLRGDDPRVVGTIRAIERNLMSSGFVNRYDSNDSAEMDGLHGREGAFLACSFWLVDAYVLAGRGDDARALFERLVAVRNDVGLLSEEYDTERRRLVGNFPQAFSHVALVNSAFNLSEHSGPARERATT